nr:nucleotide-binding alpha-beta plait domain-containing protein [Tanacetum cinerariifolium]
VSSSKNTKKGREDTKGGSPKLQMTDPSKLNANTKVGHSITWVEVKGIPFKLWTRNTCKRIMAKWRELLDIDDQEETCFHSKRDENEGDEVPETVFENDGLANFQKEEEVLDKHDEKSEDPFNIYSLLNNNNNKERKENNSGSCLNYPPGFTPINNDESSV